jgi:hypothetical protein
MSKSKKYLDISHFYGVTSLDSQRAMLWRRLWLVVILPLWIANGGYSFIATMTGYTALGQQALAALLAGVSQAFTLIWALPIISADESKDKKPFWHFFLVIVVIAHILSFAGSAFYHYSVSVQSLEHGRKITLTNLLLGDVEFLFQGEAKEFKTAKDSIKFNTLSRLNFLTETADYFEGRAKQAAAGLDKTKVAMKGKIYWAYFAAYKEVSAHKTSLEKKLRKDDFKWLYNGQATARAWIQAVSRVSPEVLSPANASDIQLADAKTKLAELRKNRPNFNKLTGVPDEEYARNLALEYISKYPSIMIDYDTLAFKKSTGRIAEVFQAVSPVRMLEDPANLIYPGVALLVEMLMIIFNLMIRSGFEKVKWIRLCSNRDALINMGYLHANSIPAWKAHYMDTFNKPDGPFVVTLLSQAIDVLRQLQDAQYSGRCVAEKGTMVFEVDGKDQKEKIDFEVPHSSALAESDKAFIALDKRWTDRWLADYHHKSEYRTRSRVALESVHSDTEIGHFIRPLVIEILLYLRRTRECIIVENRYYVKLSGLIEWLAALNQKCKNEGRGWLPPIYKPSRLIIPSWPAYRKYWNTGKRPAPPIKNEEIKHVSTIEEVAKSGTVEEEFRLV